MNRKYPGSTHRGLNTWLIQRLTSLYVAGFVVFLIVRFVRQPVTDYVTWHAWWSGIGVRVALALFVASLVAHAWIGMRSIFMDYIRPWWLRFAVSSATALVLALVALWSARVPLLGPQ